MMDREKSDRAATYSASSKSRSAARRRWLRVKREVLARDGFRCEYCRNTPDDYPMLLEVDHITQRSLGGTDDPDNLVTACRRCNAEKAACTLTREDILRAWVIARNRQRDCHRPNDAASGQGRLFDD